MNLYLALKLVHIAAAVVFLGNIVTGLFWHRHAERNGDPALLAHTMDGIIASDRWFTIPGVVVLTASGIAAAVLGHLPLLRTGWIAGAIVLITISGIAFAWRVAPLQRRLRDKARVGMHGAGFDPAGYRDAARRWEAWGAVALLTPVAALVLMVLKPGS